MITVRYTGMDYVYQISMLQHKKKHLVLDSLSDYMTGFKTFFTQGSDLFSDSDPYLRQLKDNLAGMAKTTASLEKKLEKRHTYVTQAESLDSKQLDLSVETGESAITDQYRFIEADLGKGKPVRIEGYLFKRGQNAFRTWNRRWFYLSSNKVK